MAKRTAKRARTEAPSSPARSSFPAAGISSSALAGAAEAPTGGSGGGAGEAPRPRSRSAHAFNHFARLPDELVQRIFSNIEATEAYETCQLWSLNRRFSRLLQGVQWQQLRVHDEPCERLDVDISFETQNRCARVTSRIRSGALAGCRKLIIGPSPADPWRNQSFPQQTLTKEKVQACFDGARSLAETLAALASAALPLETIHFSGSWRNWPATATQRQAGIAAPNVLSLEDVALDFLTALHPAPLRSLQLDDEELTSAFIAAAEQHCLPHLQELRIKNKDLGAEHAAKLVEVWPRLRELSCYLSDGHALRNLAALPLEDLRVLCFSYAGLEEALEALNADCVRELEMDGFFFVSSRRVFAAILRFRNLEKLSIKVDHTSSDALADLGSLTKLRSLELQLSIRAAPDGGAGLQLLQAAAAAATELSAAPRFESFALTVDGGGPAGPEMDPGSLAALLRASWPKLFRLEIVQVPAAAEVMQEIALAPRVAVYMILRHAFAENDSLNKLRVFSELLGSSAAGPVIALDIKVPVALLDRARAILIGWFKAKRSQY